MTKFNPIRFDTRTSIFENQKVSQFQKAKRGQYENAHPE